MRVRSLCFVLTCLVAGPCFAASAPAGAGARTFIPGEKPAPIATPRSVRAKFRVRTVAELRTASAKVAAARVQTSAGLQKLVIPVRPKGEVAGPPVPWPYQRDRGVVLDPRTPYDKETNSSVLVMGVMYSDEVLYEAQYGKDEMVLYQGVPSGHRWNAVSASFSTLPAGNHTYTLALGHEADPKYVIIKVNEQEFTGSQLTYDAATSEMRLTFAYDATANGNTLNVYVFLNYPESAPWDYQEFHHIQLAQVG